MCNVLSKSLSKKNRGFKQYKNLQFEIAKFHGKQKNIKTDFMDKLSTKIISENQTIDFCRGILYVSLVVKSVTHPQEVWVSNECL